MRRVRAAPRTAVVVARVRGERVLGASFLPEARALADEQATTWRALGLPAEVTCGRPPLERLVVDPNAPDE